LIALAQMGEALRAHYQIATEQESGAGAGRVAAQLALRQPVAEAKVLRLEAEPRAVAPARQQGLVALRVSEQLELELELEQRPQELAREGQEQERVPQGRVEARPGQPVLQQEAALESRRREQES
jgi:hypothetical protein